MFRATCLPFNALRDTLDENFPKCLHLAMGSCMRLRNETANCLISLQKVEPRSTFRNGKGKQRKRFSQRFPQRKRSNVFGRCKVCYVGQRFVSCICVARQVARKIAQYNSALRHTLVLLFSSRDTTCQLPLCKKKRPAKRLEAIQNPSSMMHSNCQQLLIILVLKPKRHYLQHENHATLMIS